MGFYSSPVQSKNMRKSKQARMKCVNSPKPPSNTEKKFFCLGWTFSERFEMTPDPTVVVCGSGPYVYSHQNGHYPVNNGFDFGAQLSVFEATGTQVQGIQNLLNGFFLVWGGSYFAYISSEQLIEGGTVCQRNIFSFGGPIVTIKTFRNMGDSSIFEVYCADGTIQGAMTRKKGKRLSIYPKGPLRLPLRKGEMITAAFTKDHNGRIFLGTNQGRLMAVKDLGLVFITESLINSPVKQITLTITKEVFGSSALLLFENGSLINFTDKNRLTELKGRYTRISEFTFADFHDRNARNTFVGDMDGNLTAIRADDRKLEVLRIMKNVTLNPISMIEVLDTNTMILGTSMGEVHMFVERLMRSEESRLLIPASVSNSNYCYKTSNGWYFLKDNKLWNCTIPDKKNKCKTTEIYSKDKTNLTMKYMNNGNYQREFIAVYGRGDVYIHILDSSYYKSASNLHLNDCPTVIQVIPMEQCFLVQMVTGEMRIYNIDGMNNETYFLYRGNITKNRIMAAAAVVRVDKTGTEIKSECLRCCGPSMKKLPFDLLLAHEPGKITVVPVEWNQDRSQKKLPVYSFPIELDDSRVVSMLTSLRHCGGLQCLVLSKKGTLHLVFSCKPKSFPPCMPEHTAPRSYSTIATQILGPIIGNGHSLHDTSVGIFAAGFKQHTLHVCWISMSEEKPAQYFHMFAVDTASSRLPFTITAVYNQKNRSKPYEILVSYYQKTGIKEERFTYYVPGIIPGFKHSGIITDCIVSKGSSTSDQYYYSGDTDGRFSLWGLDDTTINGQTFVNDFKLNGAVTSIHSNNPDIAVSTSQGEVHFFLKMRDLKIQLIPQSIYKAGKKVTFVTSMAAYSFMIFLDDGTVKEYSVETLKEKTMGNFSISTKMAICQKHKQHQYIAALGVDGVLRRTVLKCKGGNVQMKWKISFIKELQTIKAYILAVGDYQGRIYILQTTEEGDNHYFYSDRVHKHEIIDIASAFCDNGEKFMFSLDFSGVVVMRKYMEDYTPENRPIVWVCPVPSPRKLIVLDKRRIMVLGKGVATRSF